LNKIQPISKFILNIIRLIIQLIRLIIVLIKEDSTAASTSITHIFDPKNETFSKILLINNTISYSDLKKLILNLSILSQEIKELKNGKCN